MADLTKKISSDFGVLLDAGIALRGTFIIDKGGVLRAHQKVATASGGSGEVTSGTFSPTMQQAIALVRLPLNVAIGDSVHVRLDRADSVERKLQFAIAGPGADWSKKKKR